MEAGAVPPGQHPPVQAFIVHESGRTRVTRYFLPDRTVIRKEPLGPDAEGRLRHEVAALERLRGAPGMAQLAEAPEYPGSVVLEDAGRTSLAGQAKPFATDDLTGLAVELARAVARMHQRGVMHRDITPANIVLSRDGAPCLVDFALASSLAEIRPEFTHHTEIVGTLAYLAPEQTGRTGRPVDQRADLYALGATLYELATGEPPFGIGDPLRLTHDHLARVPVPPAQVNRDVPEALSAIIMHLLEKEPDSRYQTAEGVLFDLERWRGSRGRPRAAGLRVGEHDVPLRLLPPSRLVGRDVEVAALRAAFDDALAGRCRGVLLSGAPGVGKTALADELRPVVTGRDGWFVAGKFDAYRRNLEFDATHQAFRALGRLLLAEPDDELAKVRGRILEAVGPNAALLTALLPELATLLAVSPDPGDPLTAQGRAQRASAEVLRAVASRQRPVVLFVDDLQWAGRPPLGFIDLVLNEEPVEGLLLVGAYREEDVDATHPLASMVSRWRRQAGLPQVRLENLPVAGSVAMVAEMLRVDPAAAAGLAEVIGPYTSGNPYETVELLNALRRDQVLTATVAGWRWDAAAVRAHLARSDVAGLTAARVDALPERSRQMVAAMACLGGRAGGRNVTTLVYQTGRPARVDYGEEVSGVIGQVGARDWRLRTAMGVPIGVEGRPWGAMVVAFTHEELLPMDTEARLAGFTELVATAIANAEAQAEVTVSRARIVAAADQARQRIERDLHDGAQQRLVSLALQLREARAKVPPELGTDLGRIEAGLTDALDELREMARGIHPAILANGGLRPALRTLARRSPIPVDLEVRAEGRLPEQVEVSAYYLVAEALTNAVKHARASAVSVEAEVAGKALRVAVRDDGTGGADFAGGTGLTGLKDRVEALGGRMLLDSPRGAGTSLRVELPLTAGSATPPPDRRDK